MKNEAYARDPRTQSQRLMKNRLFMHRVCKVSKAFSTAKVRRIIFQIDLAIARHCLGFSGFAALQPVCACPALNTPPMLL